MILVEIYTEETPNPESLKFVTNHHLLPNDVAEFKSKESAAESPLALMLFDLPYVKQVFLSQNFVTVTKVAEVEWYEITSGLREAIRQFLASGKKAVTEALWNRAQPVDPEAPVADNPEAKIVNLLEKYVKPAVEGDGGHISFRSFSDGVVSVVLQGSCSGCPSASITLKNGIEGLLKRMVPEVREVVAIEE
ncbi:MAG: NifU family protein [Chitinophagales bacterium]